LVADKFIKTGALQLNFKADGSVDATTNLNTPALTGT
jgi:hypothetical protein